MKTGLILLTILSTAWQVGQMPAAEKKQQRGARLLKRFDKDGDGRLSSGERAELRKFLESRRKGNVDQRQPKRMSWQVAGLERTALVYLPAKPSDKPAPVVFGFHGHGGSSRNAARTFRMHELWPEAIVVYMQGVPTAGRLTDPEGKKNGWQHSADENGARDLKFFDAVLATLKSKHQVDLQRIYSMGHSNGGGFTYLLWATRPQVFAAIAPSSAGSASLRTGSPAAIPVMHIAGEKDQLVRFSWQEATMKRVRSINRCGQEGQPWNQVKGATIYASENGSPLVTLIHPGTHKYYVEAPPLIVKFFQEHRRSETAPDTKGK